MKTQRLFELLVVGGSLWIIGCGGAVESPDPNAQPGAQGGVHQPSDGGTSGTEGGEGGGSQFW
jgi:hypothetical protein